MSKTRSWTQYNESFVNRGDVTLWFSNDVLKPWNHKNQGYPRGRPFVYSDTGMKRCGSFAKSSILSIEAPKGLGGICFLSTKFRKRAFQIIRPFAIVLKCWMFLSKRIARAVSWRYSPQSVKVYGEGKWKVYKYGRGKCRTWRKLHLATDVKT